jgi:hypothetical protein
MHPAYRILSHSGRCTPLTAYETGLDEKKILKRADIDYVNILRKVQKGERERYSYGILENNCIWIKIPVTGVFPISQLLEKMAPASILYKAVAYRALLRLQ